MAQIILDSSNNLIQGDFDNATINNRTKFKTTTTDATTNVYAVPNGSATSAGFTVTNAADPTNASKLTIATNGSTDTQIISGVNGSGTYLPLSFYVNNALAVQYGTAGEIKLGAGASSGTSGQVLTSGGAGAAVSWTTISTSPPTTLYAIGTYIVGRPYNATDYAPNATIAGSSLYGMPTDAYLNNGGTPYIYNAQAGGARQPSTDLVNTGTWRCMSRAWGNSGDTGGTGLWVRIS